MPIVPATLGLVTAYVALSLHEGFYYLVKKAAEEKISEEIILKHLQDWKFRKPTKINGKNGLFYNMLGHAKNRRNMLRNDKNVTSIFSSGIAL
jgi:hypothetical protein